jgi:glyoxalase family protein
MGGGGAAAELHVEVNPGLAMSRQGAGAVHHVAFRTPDKDQFDEWVARTAGHGVRTSGEVERFYFTSLYFREPSGVLFEIATDGPGFTADEPIETLGEALSLPPFLEGRRAQIEAGLKPLA